METAWFSLENDGLFIPDSQHISDDPFVNAGMSADESNDKPVSLLDNHYSDISDDSDFEIPCSQKRQSDRYVKFYLRFSTVVGSDLVYFISLLDGVHLILVISMIVLRGIVRIKKLLE